jgi:hypothetical protein
MKYLGKIVLISCIFLSYTGCNSTKQSASQTSKNEMKKDFLKEGYVRGIIVKNSAKGSSMCGLKVKLVETKEFLDPVGIEVDNFRNDDAIWIKFVSSRMRNRCDDARPVSVIEIKKRDE